MSNPKDQPLLIDNPKLAEMLTSGAFATIPHAQVLNLEYISAEPYKAKIRLAYREELSGHLETGIVHGGVLISMIDSVCGMAVFCSLTKMEPIATLDLRMDYLQSPAPYADIIAEAECYKLTESIAFVRAWAYHHNPQDCITASVATFMRQSAGRALGPKASQRS
ncbi:MAG TPA: PaaI family thioesterase [Gammaproteobacteria bacterium]|nr:PaaI family thioesterase [Gammaproteobacteria bacterium]